MYLGLAAPRSSMPPALAAAMHSAPSILTASSIRMGPEEKTSPLIQLYYATTTHILSIIVEPSQTLTPYRSDLTSIIERKIASHYSSATVNTCVSADRGPENMDFADA